MLVNLQPSTSRVPVNVSAYIPCFNNRRTIAEVIASVRQQTVAVHEIVVVDDASTDGSPEVARAAGARVAIQPSNLGRGPARRRGMEETSAQFVVSCDATYVIPPDYLARAKVWMERPEVGAVYGRISQEQGGDAVTRWRGRHLFKVGAPKCPATEVSSFATTGSIVRRSAVEAVGNYDASLRHTEDAELGSRLIRGGWKIICDPDLVVYSVAQNSLGQVLERYWRWHAGVDERLSFGGYLRKIWFSIRCMAPHDLREGDPAAALISLLLPHAQLWRTLFSSKKP